MFENVWNNYYKFFIIKQMKKSLVFWEDIFIGWYQYGGDFKKFLSFFLLDRHLIYKKITYLEELYSCRGIIYYQIDRTEY